jgi:hypothetical protein
MIVFVDASRRLANRTVVRTLELFTHLRDAIMEAREHPRKLESELFRDRYHISSKNDDDLPIVR